MMQTAYDLDTFANRSERATPRIRVERGGKRKRRARAGIRGFEIVAVTAILLGMVCSLLYSQATVTELTTDIQAAQTQLTEAKSEYDYLSSTLSTKTNLKTVEEVAGSQLGLIKMDKSQVTYIDLQKSGAISRPESQAQKLFGSLQSIALNLASELNP